MCHEEVETKAPGRRQENTRLAALASYAILDTPPEPCYDTLTRLAAEYLCTDSACLGFADESRVWLKSWWGQNIREIPRKDSIFDMVLARDCPIVVPDVAQYPYGEHRASSSTSATRPFSPACRSARPTAKSLGP